MSAVIIFAAGLVSFAGSQPQLAGDGRQAVYAAFGSGDVVQVARSRDGGATFAAPVSLPAAGKMALGMRRGPRIAVTRDAFLVATIAGATGGGADGDLRLYRSIDGGRTFAAPIVINDVPGAAREGMHALAANDAGLVVAAWLDLREKGTRIYAAISRDHGATWAPDTLVYASPDGAVCECCHPSVAVARDGRIAVLFRNHTGGLRDMYVVQSRDGAAFAPAVKQGQGSWTLAACPMDGGGLAIRSGDVATVWRREDAVFLADGLRPAEERLGAGKDPAIGVAANWLDVAWTGADGVALRQSGKPVVTLGPGRFPTLLALPTHTLVATEHQGRVEIRRVPR
jgi:hypothetical protein